jgi:hypothetical protein
MAGLAAPAADRRARWPLVVTVLASSCTTYGATARHLENGSVMLLGYRVPSDIYHHLPCHG